MTRNWLGSSFLLLAQQYQGRKTCGTLTVPGQISDMGAQESSGSLIIGYVIAPQQLILRRLACLLMKKGWLRVRGAAATLGRASSLPGQPTSYPYSVISVDLRANACFIGQFPLSVNTLAYHQNKWTYKELVSSATTLADQRISPGDIGLNLLLRTLKTQLRVTYMNIRLLSTHHFLTASSSISSPQILVQQTCCWAKSRHKSPPWWATRGCHARARAGIPLLLGARTK